MRHVPDGTLRRLVDEPLAVPDGEVEHISGCGRCARRSEQVFRDAAAVAAFFARPQLAPDIDLAWNRLQVPPPASPAAEGALRRVHARWSWRLSGVRVPSMAALAACAVLVAGVAAAAVLATISGPAPLTPEKAVPADFQAIADAAGLEGSGVIGGFATPSGSLRLPFGVLRWSSSGRAASVASIAAADAATGLGLRLPASLPAGVGALQQVLVQPEVRAAITFDSGAGPALAGTSLVVTAGPAVLVEYGSSLGSFGLPSLAVFAMARPVASTPGAASARVAAYLLSRPGLPAGLAQEIRLLGDLGTSLPVPATSGADVSQVDVGGSPGILVTEASGAASGVIFEDRAGIVHAALGLLDQKDVLSVANQLG